MRHDCPIQTECSVGSQQVKNIPPLVPMLCPAPLLVTDQNLDRPGIVPHAQHRASVLKRPALLQEMQRRQAKVRGAPPHFPGQLRQRMRLIQPADARYEYLVEFVQGLSHRLTISIAANSIARPPGRVVDCVVRLYCRWSKKLLPLVVVALGGRTAA